jgi:hypothetical protein
MVLEFSMKWTECGTECLKSQRQLCSSCAVPLQGPSVVLATSSLVILESIELNGWRIAWLRIFCELGDIAAAKIRVTQ